MNVIVGAVGPVVAVGVVFIMLELQFSCALVFSGCQPKKTFVCHKCQK